MAGIYIHIPFCKKKCNYCNFYSVASLKKAEGFSKLIIAELRLRKAFLEGREVKTIYFGGGTPSLLDIPSINGIIAEVAKNFTLSTGAEITIEANPDDLTKNYVDELALSPVNRLSIGVQSFSDKDLLYLGRLHDAQKAEQSLQNAIDAGFKNISIDLIYGIPGQDEQTWISSLEKVKTYSIPHLSAYWLTVEQKTALAILAEKGKITAPDEETGIRHFRILREWAHENAYEHYEISNFCSEGMYSKHNTAYWNNQVYLGIGPSAHSYDGNARYWAVSGLNEYTNAILKGKPAIEKEILSINDLYNEYVMTRLRTMWGCNSEEIKSIFGPEMCEYFEKQAAQFLSSGLMEIINGQYTLTEEGMLRADGISSSLFFV